MAEVAVLIPTHNHTSTLKYAVRSVLQQTFSNFEIFIIGDGATEETIEAAQSLTKSDSRVNFRSYPKSPRTGELYRHELLLEINSKYICYLSDDDLWFPDHLEIIRNLLQEHDFCYTFPFYIDEQDQFGTWYGDVTMPFFKEWLMSKSNQRYNFIPLSAAAHTLKSYRQLPVGWQSTPVGKHTDLHMWQQWFNKPGVRVARGKMPSVFHFPSSMRRNMSAKQRNVEIAKWFKRLNNPALREAVVIELLNAVYRNNLEIQASVRSTKTFQVHQAVKKFIASVFPRL